MPDGFIRFFTLDLEKRTDGIQARYRARPAAVPGTFAVGIDPNDPSPRKGGVKDPMAPVSTLRPWKNGSNMDINEIRKARRFSSRCS